MSLRGLFLSVDKSQDCAVNGIKCIFYKVGHTKIMDP